MDEQCGISTNHIAFPFDAPLIGSILRAIQVITFFSSITKYKYVSNRTDS